MTPLDLLSSAAFGVVFGAGVTLGTLRSTIKRHDQMIGNGKPGVFVRTEAMEEWRALVKSWRESDAERTQRLEQSLKELRSAVLERA